MPQAEIDPVKLEPTRVSGKIRFSCCTVVQEAEGQSLEIVTCKVCQRNYGLVLAMRLSPVDDPLWHSGTELEVQEDTKARVGTDVQVISKGTRVKVHNDVYQMLEIPPGLVAVEVEKAGSKGIERITAIPNAVLKEIEKVNDGKG